MLIDKSEPASSGWVFIYEHVSLLSGIGVGSVVTKGQLIARTPAGITSNHMQLTFWKNTFLKNHKCWIDYLASSSFLNYFNNTIRNDAQFITGWNSAVDEGQYAYKELLNTSKFPRGAKLCYTLGTDIRIPVS